MTLEAIANASGEALEDAARSYFLWWDQGFGASFYRGLALYLLWTDATWAAPQSEEMRDKCESDSCPGATRRAVLVPIHRYPWML